MTAGESANKCQNPGEKVDADLMGPTEEAVNKERYAFVTKDEASNFLKAAGIVNKEATATRDALLKLYGQLAEERQRLKVFRTDGGTEFIAEFEELLKAWHVHHEVGNLPDKPTTGARIERMM